MRNKDIFKSVLISVALSVSVEEKVFLNINELSVFNEIIFQPELSDETQFLMTYFLSLQSLILCDTLQSKIKTSKLFKVCLDNISL